MELKSWKWLVKVHSSCESWLLLASQSLMKLKWYLLLISNCSCTLWVQLYQDKQWKYPLLVSHSPLLCAHPHTGGASQSPVATWAYSSFRSALPIPADYSFSPGLGRGRKKSERTRSDTWHWKQSPVLGYKCLWDLHKWICSADFHILQDIKKVSIFLLKVA